MSTALTPQQWSNLLQQISNGEYTESVLTLIHKHLKDDYAKELVEAIKRNRHIRILNLAFNKITALGCTYLSELELEELDLTRNDLGEGATKAFLNSDIQKLKLAGTGIGDKDLEYLASNPHIKILEVSYNTLISKKGLSLFLEKNPSISLTYNEYTSDDFSRVEIWPKSNRPRFGMIRSTPSLPGFQNFLKRTPEKTSLSEINDAGIKLLKGAQALDGAVKATLDPMGRGYVDGNGYGGVESLIDPVDNLTINTKNTKQQSPQFQKASREEAASIGAEFPRVEPPRPVFQEQSRRSGNIPLLIPDKPSDVFTAAAKKTAKTFNQKRGRG